MSHQPDRCRTCHSPQGQHGGHGYQTCSKMCQEIILLHQHRPECSPDRWAGVLLHLSLDTLLPPRLCRHCTGQDRRGPYHSCRTLPSSGKTIHTLHILITPLWLRGVEISIPTGAPREHLGLLQLCPGLALHTLGVVAGPARNIINKPVRTQLLSELPTSVALVELVTLYRVLHCVLSQLDRNRLSLGTSQPSVPWACTPVCPGLQSPLVTSCPLFLETPEMKKD